jgi:hypothetical protein
LFFAGEQALWRDPRFLRFGARYAPPGPGDPLIVSARTRLLPPPGDAPPVLLLGSSQVREGLDCAAFERALPGRACANLAVGGGSPLDVGYVARRSRARWPRRIVVIGVFPKVMHMPPKAAFVDGSTVSALVRGGAWRRMPPSDWMEVAYGLAGAASETLRNRDALLALRGTAGRDWRRAWRLQVPPQPDRLLAAEEPQPERYFDNRLGLVDFDTLPGAYTGAQEAALDASIAAERGRGNPVVLVDFPTRPGYTSTLPPSATRHYERLRARLFARRDVTLVGEEDLPTLHLADFQDFTHLSARGRRKVSARLAEIVREVSLR